MPLLYTNLDICDPDSTLIAHSIVSGNKKTSIYWALGENFYTPAGWHSLPAGCLWIMCILYNIVYFIYLYMCAQQCQKVHLVLNWRRTSNWNASSSWSIQNREYSSIKGIPSPYTDIRACSMNYPM